MIFTVTLNQILFLLVFIILGWILMKCKTVPVNSHTVLSKLENYLFIPALVLETFINQFTQENISMAWGLLWRSFILEIIIVVLSVLVVRFCSKDKYEQRIFCYGLCFSNFGFMGNAVVSILFPDVFLEYLIYQLPLWILIYLWGVPKLLIANDAEQTTISQRLKNLGNPIFVSMLIGMLIGTSQIPVPSFLGSAISSAGKCMSPLAMLLTGMTIAQFSLKDILKKKGVYVVTALRLLVYPMLFIAILMIFPMERTFATCTLCAIAMPLGLNTIIIPSAYGRDASVASGMALISHVFASVTIPLVVMLFNRVIR